MQRRTRKKGRKGTKRGQGRGNVFFSAVAQRMTIHDCFGVFSRGLGCLNPTPTQNIVIIVLVWSCRGRRHWNLVGLKRTAHGPPCEAGALVDMSPWHDRLGPPKGRGPHIFVSINVPFGLCRMAVARTLSLWYSMSSGATAVGSSASDLAMRERLGNTVGQATVGLCMRMKSAGGGRLEVSKGAGRKMERQGCSSA